MKAKPRKVRKTNFQQRAITHEKVGQPWRKTNLICNSSYGSFLPTFIQISESIAEKSLENECDGQTDRLTDGLTDWLTECKPIVPSGFTGGGLYSPLRFHRWGTKNVVPPKVLIPLKAANQSQISTRLCTLQSIANPFYWFELYRTPRYKTASTLKTCKFMVGSSRNHYFRISYHRHKLI